MKGSVYTARELMELAGIKESFGEIGELTIDGKKVKKPSQLVRVQEEFVNISVDGRAYRVSVPPREEVSQEVRDAQAANAKEAGAEPVVGDVHENETPKKKKKAAKGDAKKKRG